MITCRKYSRYVSLSVTVEGTTYPSIHLSIYPSIYAPIHLSIYPSIYAPIYPSIYPSIHPVSIYLSILTLTLTLRHTYLVGDLGMDGGYGAVVQHHVAHRRSTWWMIGWSSYPCMHACREKWVRGREGGDQQEGVVSRWIHSISIINYHQSPLSSSLSLSSLLSSSHSPMTMEL